MSEKLAVLAIRYFESVLDNLQSKNLVNVLNLMRSTFDNLESFSTPVASSVIDNLINTLLNPSITTPARRLALDCLGSLVLVIYPDEFLNEKYDHLAKELVKSFDDFAVEIINFCRLAVHPERTYAYTKLDSFLVQSNLLATISSKILSNSSSQEVTIAVLNFVVNLWKSKQITILSKLRKEKNFIKILSSSVVVAKSISKHQADQLASLLFLTSQEIHNTGKEFDPALFEQIRDFLAKSVYFSNAIFQISDTEYEKLKQLQRAWSFYLVAVFVSKPRFIEKLGNGFKTDNKSDVSLNLAKSAILGDLIQLALSSEEHVLQDVTVLLATKWKTTEGTAKYLSRPWYFYFLVKGAF